MVYSNQCMASNDNYGIFCKIIYMQIVKKDLFEILNVFVIYYGHHCKHTNNDRRARPFCKYRMYDQEKY